MKIRIKAANTETPAIATNGRGMRTVVDLIPEMANRFNLYDYLDELRQAAIWSKLKAS